MGKVGYVVNIAAHNANENLSLSSVKRVVEMAKRTSRGSIRGRSMCMIMLLVFTLLECPVIHLRVQANAVNWAT